MRRHILDALIIGMAVGLGASSLYAQVLAGRAAVHASPAAGATGSAVHRVAERNGGIVLRPTEQGQTPHRTGSELAHADTCSIAVATAVSCSK
jgi:hypothetical protein